jgi:hypothetical protein
MGKSKSLSFYSQPYEASCTTENAATLLLACSQVIDDSIIPADGDCREDVQQNETADNGDDELILNFGSEEEDWDEDLDEF